MKKPRPTVVENIQAKQSARQIQNVDLQNLVVAARLALRQLNGTDLVNVSTSIANIEALFAPAKQEQAPEASKPETKAE